MINARLIRANDLRVCIETAAEGIEEVQSAETSAKSKRTVGPIRMQNQFVCYSLLTCEFKLPQQLGLGLQTQIQQTLFSMFRCGYWELDNSLRFASERPAPGARGFFARPS